MSAAIFPDNAVGSRSAKASRAITIDERPTGSTLEIVPSLQWLYTADHRLAKHERIIAVGTEQLRGWCLRRGCNQRRPSDSFRRQFRLVVYRFHSQTHAVLVPHEASHPNLRRVRRRELRKADRHDCE